MAETTTRRARRAVIVGGSMSGLFTAAFLRRIGWDVDVYERSAVDAYGWCSSAQAGDTNSVAGQPAAASTSQKLSIERALSSHVFGRASALALRAGAWQSIVNRA